MSYYANLAIPGFGTLEGHSVGTCNHTTGYDHYFLPEGAEKRISGHVRFSAEIDSNGEVAWRFVYATGPNDRKRPWGAEPFTEDNQLDYPAEVIAAMRHYMETLHERDPFAWFHHVVGAIDMERDTLRGAESRCTNSIQTLTELLAKPHEPQTHFVSAEEAGQPKGYFRPATCAEREARRNLWRENKSAHENRLARLRAANGERLEMLDRIRAALFTWAENRRKNERLCPLNACRSAITVPALAA